MFWNKTRLIILLLFFIILSFGIKANGPCSAIFVPSDGVIFYTYNLAGQAPSGIDTPSCGMYFDPDIWFAFTAPASGQVIIEVRGITIGNPAMAIYSGGCANVEEKQCVDGQHCGDIPDPGTRLNDLIPGAQYYIRVWSETGNPGTFKLRVLDPTVNYFNNQYNAYNTSTNCVQLTTANPSQRGCSWYHVPYDFEDPIELEFELEFGNNDAGADGICFVLSTSPDNCGEVGGGIGALGIPNSVIIEFDTWDNGGGVSDIPEDHIAVSLNGQMATPIAGPISLGNIEDGQPHSATISWEPSTMTLNVYFDGALIISLPGFDIVNLAFNGSSTAYWGWTASTGGAMNNQSFCFNFSVDNTSSINEKIDPQICEGETFVSPEGNQFTQTGTYSESFIASNGCPSVRTINLNVNPLPIGTKDVTICAYQSYSEAGNNYSVTGIYNYNVPGQPCDSNITLNLTAIDFFIGLTVSNEINCGNGYAVVSANITDITGVFVDYSNIEYQWSTDVGQIISGQGTDQITVNKGGIYYLTLVVNGNNITCSFNATPVVVIEDLTPPTAQIIQENPLDCQNPATTLSGAGSFPTPLLYNWYTIGGTITTNTQLNEIGISGPGIYYLEITNMVNGCKDTTSITVELEAFTASANINVSGILDCRDTSVTLTAVLVNDPGNLNIEWTTVDGNILTDPESLEVTVNEAGVYMFTISDAAGCKKDFSLTVNSDFTQPTITVSAPDTLNCRDIIATLEGHVLNLNQNFNFSWANADSSYLNTMDSIIQINKAGTYVFTVINEVNHCVSFDTVEIFSNTVPPDIEPFTADLITCTQTSVQLTGNIAIDPSQYQYNWTTTNGNIVTSPTEATITVDQTGTYQLIVQDIANFCMDTLIVQVNGSTDQPVATAPADLVLDCALSSTILTGTYTSSHPLSDLIISWTTTDGNFGGTTNQPSVIITSPGTYYFTVTNSINQCSSTDSVVVLQNTDKPIINIVATPIITCDQPVVSLVPTWTNAGDNPTIQWSTTDGQITSPTNDSIIMVASSGTYTILVTNTLNGCLSSFNVNITEDKELPQGAIQSDGDLTCAITQTKLTFNPDQPGSYTYQWTTSNGNIISSANNTQIDVNKPGTYTLLVTSTSNGCESTFTYLVNQSDQVPQVDAGQDANLTCALTQIQLNGSVSNANDYTINWQGPDATAIVSGGQTLTPVISKPGIYIITVLNNENQCSASDTLTIRDLATTPFFANPIFIDANCQNQNGAITFQSVQQGTPPYLFTINGVNAGSDLNFDGLSTGHYVIEGIDANGCMFEFEGDIEGQEQISFLLPDTLFLEYGEPYIIVPQFLFDTINMTWHPWTGADYFVCNCLTPTIVPTHNALLELTVQDASGCVATRDVFIRVRQLDVNVFVPNAFSPGNHDGINDNVTVFTDERVVPIIDEFRIFNRWGAPVFSRENFPPNDEKLGWDGYFKGQLVNPAVFTYFVRFKTRYGEEIIKKGSITVVQ